LVNTCNYEKAIDLHRRSVEISKRQYGRNNPETVSALTQLSSALARKGALEEAENILREVIEIEKGLYGEKDLEVAGSLNMLADVLSDSEKYEEAELASRQAIDMYLNSSDEKSRIYLANEYEQLANILDAAGGREPSCEKNFQQALESTIKFSKDPEGLEVAYLQHNFASFLATRDDGTKAHIAQAETLFRSAIFAFERSSKSGNVKIPVTNSYSGLGELLVKCKREKEAERVFKKCIEILRSADEHEYNEYSTDLNNSRAEVSFKYAELIVDKRGRQKEAEETYLLGLEWAERANKIDDDFKDTWATALHNLGELYWKQKQHKDALPMLERALSTFEDVHGPKHAELLETLEVMAAVLNATGKIQEAKLARARAEAIKKNNPHGKDGSSSDGNNNDDDDDDDDDVDDGDCENEEEKLTF
jgi:tetratricopeptide (TPR) repeat protein